MKWKFDSSLMKRGNMRLALLSALSLAAMVAATPSTGAQTAGAQTYKVFDRFNGGGGVESESGVLLGADGSIYGTTYQGGGASDTRTVFKLDPTLRETKFRFPG